MFIDPNSASSSKLGACDNSQEPEFKRPKLIPFPDTLTRSGYELRDSTNFKTRVSQEKPTPRKGGRKPLNSSETASKGREEGHDSRAVNLANVEDKVNARLFYALDDFTKAYTYGCKTERGVTKYNGDHAHCGCCQAAHAALTPNVYIKICDTVQKALFERPFTQLDTPHQRYLKARFQLSVEDLDQLSSLNVKTRMDTFNRHAAQVSDHEKRVTFIATELVRNLTHQNPKFSNSFDSYLEGTLIAKVLEFAEKCSLGEMAPLDAIMEFQTEYRCLVETAIQSLYADIDTIDALQDAWNALIQSQQEGDFESYLAAAAHYKGTFDGRFKGKKPQGTATLESLENYLKTNQSPKVLTTLLRNRDQLYFDLNQHFLKTPDDADAQFEKAQVELQGRLTEALQQRDHLQNDLTGFKKLLKYGYGEKGPSGVVITPDKNRIAAALNDLLSEQPGKENVKKPRNLTDNLI